MSGSPNEQEVNPADFDPALDPRLDQLSRRTLITRAGAGVATAAAAAAGADAQAPPHALDDPSLDRTTIHFRSSYEGHPAEIEAFLAVPKSHGRRAGIVVIHEIFGLTDHIRDVACRLAQAGYVALAPNLFTRSGSPPPLSGGFGPLGEFVAKVPDAQLMADLESGISYLGHRHDATGKIGCIGFCWGGRISMLLDAASPRIDAAVAYYGRISGTATVNQPSYPIDVVGKMHAPLLGNYGADDTGIPPSEAEKLKAALLAAHKTAEIYVYEGAGHAFNNDTRESYRPAAAKLAWQRTLNWFGHYLQTG